MTGFTMVSNHWVMVRQMGFEPMMQDLESRTLDH